MTAVSRIFFTRPEEETCQAKLYLCHFGLNTSLAFHHQSRLPGSAVVVTGRRRELTLSVFTSVDYSSFHPLVISNNHSDPPSRLNSLSLCCCSHSHNLVANIFCLRCFFLMKFGLVSWFYLFDVFVRHMKSILWFLVT